MSLFTAYLHHVEHDADLLQFYAQHLRAGAIDLSSSCPPPMPLGAMCLERIHADDLAFVPPSGAPDLRAAIAARYASVAPDDILIASGASEALVAVAFAVLGPGDLAWAANGPYPSFVEAVRKVGARLACGGGVGTGARLALGCNPTVPDGRVVDLPAFLAACARVEAIPVMDEVYRDLHRGGPLPALVDLSGQAISIGDLSKPLGLGGLRIGWLATRDSALLARLDRQLQLLSGGPASLSVAAALAAFESFDEMVPTTVRVAHRNEPEIVAVLARHGWRATPSEAGITILATPPRLIRESALERVEEAGFFLLPGETIGAPGAFRISLLCDPGSLDRALSLLDTQP